MKTITSILAAFFIFFLSLTVNADPYTCLFFSGTCQSCTDVGATVIYGCNSRDLYVADCGVNYTSYQWQVYNGLIYFGGSWIEDWGDISGETARDFTVASTGRYRCRYVNSGTTYFTESVTVNISTSGPSIATHPSDQTVCLGYTGTFKVSSSGSYRSHQWQNSTDGTTWSDISGETDDSLVVTASTGNNGYMYRCEVSNACNTIYSNSATLTLETPPAITNPSSTTVCEGNNAVFEVTASNDYSRLQWYEGSTANPVGTNSETLTLSSVTTGMSGNEYFCVAEAGTACGSAYDNTSNKATLTVNAEPTVTSPSDQSVCEGHDVSFSVVPGGDYVLIQWEYFNGSTWQDYPGGNTETLNLTSVASSWNNYKFRCRVESDATCNTTVTSASDATLTVETPPTITNPTSTTECEGDNAVFEVTASNDYSRLQWYEGSIANPVGTNSETLTLPSITTGMSGNEYFCVAEAGTACGSAYDNTSNKATLTVNAEPTVTSPSDQSVCEGHDVSFSVIPGGDYVLIQWEYFDGSSWQDYPGGNAETLNLTAVDYSWNNYQFRCRVESDATCNTTVTSASDATLTVKRSPTITDPVDQTKCENENVTFSITPGGDYFSLQWQYNDGEGWQDVPSGGTSVDLQLNNIADSMDQYQYHCIAFATSPCSVNDTSNPATLTVKANPEIITYNTTVHGCNGDNTTFIVHAEGENKTYQWVKNGTTNLGPYQADSFYTVNVTMDKNYNTYSVRVKNSCDIVTSEDATLYVDPLPVVGLGEDMHICDGDTYLLDAGNPGASYNWNNGDADTKTYEVSTEGNHFVEVTDTNGCKNTDSVYLYVDPNLAKVDLGPDTTICLTETVTLDATDVYDTYIWNGSAGSSILDVTEEGEYYVEVQKDNNVCKEYDTIYIDVFKPYADEQICMVTVDTASGKNLITWQKTDNVATVEYKVYKETSLNNYEVIGTVPFDNLTVFVDTSSKPAVQAEKYKIAVVDTCGNESALSPYHQTIHLSINEAGAGAGYNLQWNHYMDENNGQALGSLGTGYYYIYRGTSPTNIQVYDSLSASNISWTDTDTSETYYYRIAIKKNDACDPTAILKASAGPFSQSISNMEDNRLKEVMIDKNLSARINLNIYPNPFRKQTTIAFTIQRTSRISIEVYNVVGEKLETIVDKVQETGDYRYQYEPGMPGVYYLQFTIDGNMVTKKIIGL